MPGNNFQGNERELYEDAVNAISSRPRSRFWRLAKWPLIGALGVGALVGGYNYNYNSPHHLEADSPSAEKPEISPQAQAVIDLNNALVSSDVESVKDRIMDTELKDSTYESVKWGLGYRPLAHSEFMRVCSSERLDDNHFAVQFVNERSGEMKSFYYVVGKESDGWKVVLFSGNLHNAVDEYRKLNGNISVDFDRLEENLTIRRIVGKNARDIASPMFGDVKDYAVPADKGWIVIDKPNRSGGSYNYDFGRLDQTLHAYVEAQKNKDSKLIKLVYGELLGSFLSPSWRGISAAQTWRKYKVSLGDTIIYKNVGYDFDIRLLLEFKFEMNGRPAYMTNWVRIVKKSGVFHAR